jgi:2,3-bisphosphoglycerate-dependent phosphoglycerate mutase
LQGLDKAETADRYGPEQVRLWRRGYDVAPPPLAADDPRHPRFDPRYASVGQALLPAGESLEDTLLRVLPYWRQEMAPQIRPAAIWYAGPWQQPAGFAEASVADRR